MHVQEKETIYDRGTACDRVSIHVKNRKRYVRERARTCKKEGKSTCKKLHKKESTRN